MRFCIFFSVIIPIISLAYELEYTTVDISEITSENIKNKTVTILAKVESCENTDEFKQKISELKLGIFSGCEAVSQTENAVMFDVNMTLGGRESPQKFTLRRSENPKKEYEFGAYFNNDWADNVQSAFGQGFAMINLNNDSNNIHYRSLVHSVGALFNKAPASNFTHWLEPGKDVNVLVPLVSDHYLSLMDRKLIREPSALFLATMKRAESGDPQAQYEIANLYDGMNEHIQHDLSKAHEWYIQAADNGHVTAQYKAGENFYWMYKSNGDPERLALSLKYIEKAAGANNPHAQFRLAHFLRSDLYGIKDISRATVLMVASAKQGYSDAQNALGLLYFFAGNKTEGYAWKLKMFGGLKHEQEELDSLASLMTPDEIKSAEQRAKTLEVEFPVKEFDYY